MNKRTVALTTDQYKSIISTIKKGFLNHRPNERIATALMLEANLGLRISDILKLRLSDITASHPAGRHERSRNLSAGAER